jgi:putrescine transport system substrate-binding protein
MRLAAAATLLVGFAAWGQDKPAQDKPTDDKPAEDKPAGDKPAAEKLVDLYNWSGYFSPDVLADFTKATGIRTKVSTYDSQETALATVTAAGSGHDVVILGAEPFFEAGLLGGAFQKLDPAKLPNRGNQDPAVLKLLQVADPTGEYTAVYLWGTIGLTYNMDEVKKRVPDAPLDSYALLFNPVFARKLQYCGIALIDNPDIILPMALLYLGLDPKTAGAPEYERAAAVVAKIRPFVRSFDSNTLVSNLAGRKLCLATQWNGDAVQAINRVQRAKPPAPVPGSTAKPAKKDTDTGPALTYVIPREGGLAFIDVMAVPKDAPHPTAAHAFIDYLLQPKPAAQTAYEMGYGNAIPSSRALILDPAVAADTRLFPPAAQMPKLTLVKMLDPVLQSTVQELWSKARGGG